MSEQTITEDWEGLGAIIRKDESRRLPEKLSDLRRKLYNKAKQAPKFRFYALYDRIYRRDVLEASYHLCRKNGKSPGIDGVSFEEIEANEGIVVFLDRLYEELRTKRYRPDAVKRVFIPKDNGGQRALGIPTIRDRVVQMAAVLILEPIFEADFLGVSYGFRPTKNAHQALDAIQKHLKSGYQSVYDADLQGYFDSIPHDRLLACVKMRVADRSVLKLIKFWLNVPVIESGKKGCGKTSQKGTPQGGVISPLLANIYLHWFDKVFHMKDGPANWANAKLVRYADDFVILARYQSERLQQWVEDTLEGWMGLKLNRDKTQIIQLNETGACLDFLGFTFRYDKDRYGGSHRYLNVCVSKKSLQKQKERLRAMTDSRMCFKPIPALICELNRQLTGWSNYYRYGYPRKAFREINRHARMRVFKHLRRRSQRRYRPPEDVTWFKHIKELGLIYL